MVTEKSQIKTAMKELEKELEVANKAYREIKAILDRHNEERMEIGAKYTVAQERVKEIESAIATLSTLTG